MLSPFPSGDGTALSYQSGYMTGPDLTMSAWLPKISIRLVSNQKNKSQVSQTLCSASSIRDACVLVQTTLSCKNNFTHRFPKETSALASLYLILFLIGTLSLFGHKQNFSADSDVLVYQCSLHITQITTRFLWAISGVDTGKRKTGRKTSRKFLTAKVISTHLRSPDVKHC